MTDLYCDGTSVGIRSKGSFQTAPCALFDRVGSSFTVLGENAMSPHTKQVQAIKATEVPASDIQLGLVIFPGDVILQRAFFQFCKYVRLRLPSHSTGVVPINSHRRWRAWTESKYAVLQGKLSDFGICVPVSPAASGQRSTGFKIALPPATGEVFTSWTLAVWEVCGRDRSALRRHFSRGQVKRFFSDNELRAV